MSSIVYFKFKANVKTDSVSFDGSSISVKDLKNAIRTKCCLYSTDFDLKLEDTTGKTYSKDDELIPKYSSIVVRRVPRLVAESQKKKSLGPDELTWRELQKGHTVASETSHGSKPINLADSDLPEEEKIKLMMERSSETYSEANFSVRAKPYGVPPAAYICHKCNQPGHWIHNCPGVRDKTGKVMDAKLVKRPTGIPQDFLLEVAAGTPGAYLGKSGKYMVPIKDAEAYAQGKKDKRPFSVEENPPYVPQERNPPKQLICPLCSKLFTDAVLVSCCGTTYCNECIMGHVFDSQVLGSHKCPNCDAVLTDHESSVFENALVRSLIRDWLADGSKIVDPEVIIPGDIAMINENETAFVNCRRVLKPKQAMVNVTAVKLGSTTSVDSSHTQSSMKMQPIVSESNSVFKNEHTHLPLNISSETPQCTNSVTFSNSLSSFDNVRVSEMTTSVVTNNTNATVVTSSPCTTLVGNNRQNLLPITCLSNTQIPCLSYTSSAAVMPTLLPGINGGSNSFLNALYSIRLDDLQAPLVAPSTILPATYGSLVGDPEWTAETALAASAAQSAGLVDPVLQVNNNQVAFGLVPGQSIPGTMHTALSTPVETLNGHKMLSKEEFYRLKMEVLHSARRRHRHRSRSRSPGYTHRTERLYEDSSRHRRACEREERGRRSRYHSPINYESERSRYRHRYVNEYESHCDGSGTHRYHYRPTYIQDFDDERRHYSREHPYSPEHRSWRSPKYSPSCKDDLYGYKGRESSLSATTHEFSDRRRYREPHIGSGHYDEVLIRQKRSRTPMSVVPQYDVSDPESIGPRNPSLPRDTCQMQFDKPGPNQVVDSFNRVSHTLSCETFYGDSTKQSPISLDPTNDLISKDECLLGHSLVSAVVTNDNETFPPQVVKKVKAKREKRHKKHKHKHYDKRVLTQLADDSTGQVFLNANDDVTSCPNINVSDTKRAKKHKKHKKHKHGSKENKKKDNSDTNSLVQCISLDTIDVNEFV
ncbi:hypothetical protein MN116_002148 [Schistosoma mekongi]|uniref:E3 ubiquitin-protein ligase RBBP6 n=1 Tax=Schistosoma mekongi TaxID=38744 RepID=A0AAE1ZKA0_SCHME|nr:hypothetical protein MN116_002148 [Schistosoma mekongi]